MSDKHVPTYGYEFERIAVLNESYRWSVGETVESDDEDRRINFFWDWLLVDEDEFYVVLGCRLAPSSDHPAEVAVTMVGDFTVSEEGPSLPLPEFVFRMAPVIMFPYVREVVSSITARGMSGAYHLPPLDIAAIIADTFDFESATGTKDLHDNPELAVRLGVPLPPKSAARKRTQPARSRSRSPAPRDAKNPKKS